ncbi:MAG: quaternary ammonium compound efflux SMR transporter SugE [Phycisphaerales bacterium]|nr:quaternary ammonium compound efflux SMR transporter SugE [Phycisphaerales bacterium]
MAWFILVIAGLFEVGWAIGLKYTHGFTRLWPSVWTVIAIIISMGLLGIAARHLPIGTAYAVWTGIGAIGAVIVGILLLGEPVSAARIGCLVLIVSGIVGLKIVTPATPKAQPPATTGP